MKSYSAVEVFKPHEIDLWQRAIKIVEALPDMRPPEYDWLRCHEVARVVGRVLNLEVQDGHYGLVDHSWCRIRRDVGDRSMFIETWSVLDVYVVGRLPQVQLVSDVVGIREYRRGAERSDIQHGVVDSLVMLLPTHLK